MFEHRASRLAIRGSAVVAGGALMLGMSGTAFANSSDYQGQTKGDNEGGNTSQSLVNVSHNNIPIQACHDVVPVNVLAALGLGVAGDGEANPSTDMSCHQPAAQQN